MLEEVQTGGEEPADITDLRAPSQNAWIAYLMITTPKIGKIIYLMATIPIITKSGIFKPFKPENIDSDNYSMLSTMQLVREGKPVGIQKSNSHAYPSEDLLPKSKS